MIIALTKRNDGFHNEVFMIGDHIVFGDKHRLSLEEFLKMRRLSSTPMYNSHKLFMKMMKVEEIEE